MAAERLAGLAGAAPGRAFGFGIWRLGRAALLPVLACAALAACAGDDGRPPPCPEVVNVTGAMNLVRFNDRGRDLTDIVFEAQIRDTALICVYDEGAIESDMRLTIEAMRGPANPERLARFAYFVAIATRDKEILAREEFPLEVPFPGNQTRIAAVEEISQRIPLKRDENGNDYIIYVGLALRPGELEYNLENR